MFYVHLFYYVYRLNGELDKVNSRSPKPFLQHFHDQNECLAGIFCICCFMLNIIVGKK